VFGTPIPPKADLSLRWEAPTNGWPRSVWVYRLLPNNFSPEVISNAMALCLLTAKEITKRDMSGIGCRSADGSRKLSIAFSSGRIDYEAPERRYGPTNLAVGVPTMAELPELATNVIQKLGIDLSDLKGYYDASKFYFGGPETWYYVDKAIVTNFAYRTVSFRRSVEGIPISGGDGGTIDFGEHSKIRRIAISWRKLEPIKSFQTYSPEMVMRQFRGGKAIQGLVPGNFSGINWRTVKSVIITHAMPGYCSGNSDVLYPFLALTALVETDEGKVEIEIDTPLIDETQSAF
jgi:hypothetical protein